MKIKLLINTAYGKIGDIVSVHPSRGDRMVASGQAVLVEEADTKSAAKPGRAKPLILNKSLGAGV